MELPLRPAGRNNAHGEGKWLRHKLQQQTLQGETGAAHCADCQETDNALNECVTVILTAPFYVAPGCSRLLICGIILEKRVILLVYKLRPLLAAPQPVSPSNKGTEPFCFDS